MDNTEIERRRFHRVSTSFDVEYSVDGQDSSGKKSLARNIGLGGIYFIAYEKLEIDSLLSLILHLPDGKQPLLLQGRLIWGRKFSAQDSIDRYDIGIEFIKPDSRIIERLFDYISKLSG